MKLNIRKFLYSVFGMGATSLLLQPVHASGVPYLPTEFGGAQLDDIVTFESALNVGSDNLFAGHRSHSSHRSHYSSRTSSYKAPAQTYTPAVTSSPSIDYIVETPSSSVAQAKSYNTVKKNTDALKMLVMRVQLALFQKGYDVGVIDGVMGPKTSTAIRNYQSLLNLKKTGTMTTEVLNHLEIKIP